MAVDNQLLAGTVCIVLIASVVAMGSKRGEVPTEGGDPIPPGVPSNQTARNLVDDLGRQRSVWEGIKGTRALTAEQCERVLEDLRQLQRRAQIVFDARKRHYVTDPHEVSFVEDYGALVAEIKQASGTLSDERTETVSVPINAGEPKPTTKPPSPVTFVADEPGEEAEVPENFNAASEEHDRMLDDYAQPETSVSTSFDKSKSAFKTQPDPLNDPDNKPAGGQKRAGKEVEDGVTEGPQEVVPPVKKPLLDLTQEGVSFDTVKDPPSAKEKPLPAPDKPEPALTKEQVLERPERSEEITFNSAGDIQMGPDEFETKIQSLRNRMMESDSTNEIIDLRGQIDEFERQLGVTRTPSYVERLTKITKIMGRINYYHRLLSTQPVEAQTAKRLERMGVYMKSLEAMNQKVKEQDLNAVFTSSYERAKGLYEQDYRVFGGKKRPADMPLQPPNPKRGKPTPRRSTRLASIEDQFTAVTDAPE